MSNETSSQFAARGTVMEGLAPRSADPARNPLAALVSQTGLVRVLGAHDALSARVARLSGYDAVWVSGLGVSACHGLPDRGVITLTEMARTTVLMRRASSLPILVDGDAGFADPHLMRQMVLEHVEAGATAVCIEDKTGPKVNSFQPGNRLLEPEQFAERINVAVQAAGRELSTIARIESFIVGAGLEDAIRRALIYEQAGAHGLLIHSKSDSPSEVMSFSRLARKEGIGLPLCVVPTTYPGAGATELRESGVDIVIYANQVLRAALASMLQVAREIATADRSAPVEARVATVADVFQATEALDCGVTSPVNGRTSASGIPRPAR